MPNRDQAYCIVPLAENAGLRIVARSPVGLLYGVQTLTQLIPARSTEALLCIPLLRVTDWPHLGERGFWGSDSFRHLRWIGSLKLNVVEQIAAVWVDADGTGHARLKTGREPMIEDGPRYGILPLPAVVHLEQLSGKGLFEAYHELKAQGGNKGALCYSQAPIVDVLKRTVGQVRGLAAAELNKEITRFADRDNADPATHHMPFFEDTHAVRAGCRRDITRQHAYALRGIATTGGFFLGLF